MFAADKRESAKTKDWASPGKVRSQSAGPDSTQNSVWRRLATFVQTKLAVSDIDDPYEREAELVAEQALQSSAPAVPCACADGAAGGTACPKCNENNDLKVRRQADGDGAGTVAADGLLSHLGAGRPLDPATRVFMETRLGRDFSRVRVHTDSRAAESAQAINALAYTFGNDVVFKEGQYAPETENGKRILAHELAHVAQQGRARPAEIMRIPDEGGINATTPRYSYSTNCAWIDWSHASPGRTSALIQAVQDASDRMAAGGSTTPELVAAPRMEARAPLGILLSGVTPIAHIKKPLTRDEVLSVALRIFMLQSLGFEALQNWTDSLGSSSFSEEDLPSNMIAFYMGARGFDRPRIETACDAWDAARSLTKFQGYTFQKVGQFRPLSLPPGGAWPADLSTITPAVTGGPLLDSPEGRFDTTASSFTRGLVGYEIITDPSLHIESLSGGTTIDISGTTPGSAHGPHFEVRPLPGSHNLRCRWVIKGPSDERFQMLGADESSVFRDFGPQFNAYINAPSRQALRDAGITSATILCRVRVGNVGEDAALQRLLELPVSFTW